MVTLDYAIDTVMQLPPAEREDLIDIIKKRFSQDWRKETAEFYQEIKKDIEQGNIKPVNVKEAIEDLHNYVNNPE
jgi:hypothetical protein